MKFEILKEELAKGLSIVGRAVANRAQLPVLSNVLIEAKGGVIALVATDLEILISTKVRGRIEVDGVVTVPAKMLTEFIESLPAGKIEIVLDKESLVVVAGEYKSRLQTISVEEFPKTAIETPKEGCEMTKDDLEKAVTTVAFAAAKDTLRPVLTGVLLERDGSGLKMVTTDGFRLAANKLKIEGKGEKTNYLVPSRAVLEAVKIAGEEKIRLSPLSETQIAFSSGETLLISQLIDGTFPDYQKIIPKEFETQVVVAREELLGAIKAVYVFARDNSNMVKWNISSLGIAMKAESPERGEVSAFVGAKVEGKGGEIVFNIKFVLEFLQSTQAKAISFSMSDSLKPGTFREEGNDNYLYIVMPINA